MHACQTFSIFQNRCMKPFNAHFLISSALFVPNLFLIFLNPKLHTHKSTISHWTNSPFFSFFFFLFLAIHTSYVFFLSITCQSPSYSCTTDFIALLSFNLAAFISLACIIAHVSILLPISAAPSILPFSSLQGLSVSPPGCQTHFLRLSSCRLRWLTETPQCWKWHNVKSLE